MAKDDNALYDGHTRVLGVDTNTNPADLPPGYLAGAVNRAFRGGTNRTRPSFQSLELVFDTAANQAVFEQGAIQGALGYTAVTNGASSGIVVAVADRILFGAVKGSKILFQLVHSGIDPTLLHSWFVQVQDRIYWQNGSQRPVGWDGINPAYVLNNDNGDGMPVGTFSVFVQGRLAVVTTDGYVIISDNIYGNGLTNTRGVESFIEWQQFNDIGAIGSYSQFGQTTGAIAVPLPQTINGQGQLLIMQERGAYTLDLSGARSTWLTGGIQTIALIGRGGASPHALIPANDDVWFLTSEGQISSYKTDFSDQDKQWGRTSLSREVQAYLNFTAGNLRQFVSGAVIDNRLLMSCAIQAVPCKLGGAHRYGLGMVSIDFDRGSSVSPKPGFAWDGLWTGPRPCAFAQLTVDGNLRTFILSHDTDGLNRIYEQQSLGTDGVDVVDGKEIPIRSQFDTQYLFEQRSPQERPLLKTLTGCEGIISEMIRGGEIALDYRPNFHEEWFKLMDQTPVGCPNIPDNSADRNFGTRYLPFQSPTVTPECEDGQGRLAFRAYQYQLRMKLSGGISVPFLQAKAIPKKEVRKATCSSGQPANCGPILGPGENLFEYQLPS